MRKKKRKNPFRNIRAGSMTFDEMQKKDHVGTARYGGHAYFWNYEYRHYLRDVPPSVCRRVHHALLKAGLELDGESSKHEAIITRIVRSYVRRLKHGAP
jgi:hypothetical protein